MATLAQVSDLQTPRGQQVLAHVLSLFPLLRVMQFKLDASTYNLIPNSVDSAIDSSRAVNAALDSVNFGYVSSSNTQKAYGFEHNIDDLYRGDQRVGLTAAGLIRQIENDLKRLAGKVADNVESDMIIGTGANNRMIGLHEFVKDAPVSGQTARFGFSAAEIFTMLKQVDLTINTKENQDRFVEELMKAVAQVRGANAFLCDSSMAARLNTIAIRIGAAGESRDLFGVPVRAFNGIPIITCSERAFPLESDGVNDDLHSIDIVNLAEDSGICFSTNQGFKFTDFEETESGPLGKSRL